MNIYDQLDTIKGQEIEMKYSMDLVKKWTKADFEAKKSVAIVLINKIVFYEDGSSEIIWNF